MPIQFVHMALPVLVQKSEKVMERHQKGFIK